MEYPSRNCGYSFILGLHCITLLLQPHACLCIFGQRKCLIYSDSNSYLVKIVYQDFGAEIISSRVMTSLDVCRAICNKNIDGDSHTITKHPSLNMKIW